MVRHKIVTKEGAWAAIAGIVVVGAGMGVSRVTGPEPTPTMHATAMTMNAAASTMHAAATLNAEAMTPAMMLAPFTWTGGSSDPDYWNEAANWSGAGVGYPDDASDDATFNSCGFRAEFDASRTIDDLTVDITGDFCLGYFDANGSEVTLTCDTVTITGGNDAVYVVEKAGIETN
ncbi:MAG: hypothetical protein FLDDKLPJ_03039 [Phycisphaerae bacterium]|nr:hypothetical protein [Phycisphaerae bacterium]